MRLDNPCQWCGASIDLAPAHAIKRKYCRLECQKSHYRALEKAARLAAKQGRTCQECGEPIPPERRDRVTKYCSVACQRAASASKRVNRYPGVCRICGSAFARHYPGQLYCSNSCKGKAGVLARRANG